MNNLLDDDKQRNFSPETTAVRVIRVFTRGKKNVIFSNTLYTFAFIQAHTAHG